MLKWLLSHSINIVHHIKFCQSGIPAVLHPGVLPCVLPAHLGFKPVEAVGAVSEAAPAQLAALPADLAMLPAAAAPQA
jgi:hypothetical protein